MGKGSTDSDEGDHFNEILQQYVPFEDDRYRPRRDDMLRCLATESEKHPFHDEDDNFLALVVYFAKEGFYIPEEYTERAKDYISRVLSGEITEDGWSEDCYPERLTTLKKEFTLLAHNGY